eukprot:COSAG01_NODE_2323_length_7908_cov_43.508388_17_plen_192_part_00
MSDRRIHAVGDDSKLASRGTGGLAGVAPISESAADLSHTTVGASIINASHRQPEAAARLVVGQGGTPDRVAELWAAVEGWLGGHEPPSTCEGAAAGGGGSGTEGGGAGFWVATQLVQRAAQPSIAVLVRWLGGTGSPQRAANIVVASGMGAALGAAGLRRRRGWAVCVIERVLVDDLRWTAVLLPLVSGAR